MEQPKVLNEAMTKDIVMGDGFHFYG